jgi:hypothetical protein
MDIKSINMYTWDNILRDRSRIAASHAYCNTHYLDEVERERERDASRRLYRYRLHQWLYFSGYQNQNDVCRWEQPNHKAWPVECHIVCRDRPGLIYSYRITFYFDFFYFSFFFLVASIEVDSKLTCDDWFVEGSDSEVAQIPDCCRVTCMYDFDSMSWTFVWVSLSMIIFMAFTFSKSISMWRLFRLQWYTFDMNKTCIWTNWSKSNTMI